MNVQARILNTDKFTEVIRSRIFEKLRCKIKQRLTYDSSLRMYSVQRSYSSYWSSYVNVYSGTAWTISRNPLMRN